VAGEHLVISGSILLILLGFYAWLAVRISKRAVAITRPFGIPDALCAGILALWMINVIWQSLDAPKTITLQAILANSVVYCSLILGIFGVMGFQRESAVEFFGLQPSRFPKAAWTGLLWLAASYPLILAVQGLVHCFTGDNDDAQLIVRYFLEHPDPWHRAAVIFMAVIVAPVAEEILFRGYFYGVVRRFGGRLPAILISSLLFAAIHVHLPSVPGLVILALLLCLLYERTGSLWATITMHAAFNATTILALILWPEMAG
jgi:membrane protease YdiL (CAAX protease family)